MYNTMRIIKNQLPSVLCDSCLNAVKFLAILQSLYLLNVKSKSQGMHLCASYSMHIKFI